MSLKKIAQNTLILIGLLGLFFIAIVMPLIGWNFCHVTSESMVPTLRLGDEYLCVKTDISEVKIGEIIVFHSLSDDTAQTVHRAISIEKRGREILITTKGDANKSPDMDVVTKDNYMGKAYGRVPLIGFIFGSKFVLMGFLLILGIVMILFIFLEKENPRQTQTEMSPKKTAFIILFILGICAWSLISRGITEQKMTLIENPEGRYIAEKKVVSLLPVEIVLDSDGRLSDDQFILMPGEEKIITIESDKNQVTFKSGSFFPILPIDVTYALFKWSPYSVAVAITVEILAIGTIVILVMVRKPYRMKRIKRRKVE
ncbi:MAG: signal peptidase I [Parcubacteria group bacterium]